jgi:hypothetical protein
MAPRVCPAVCEHHPWCRVDCLVHDIGGNAPKCAGRELGTTQVGLAGGISRGFFSPEFGQSAVFDLSSGSKREREERAPDERSRCVDRRRRSGSVRATGYKQRQRLPPLGQPPTRFRCRLNRRHSEADRGRIDLATRRSNHFCSPNAAICTEPRCQPTECHPISSLRL